MKNNKTQIFHFDLYGKREDKYDFLNESSLSSINWNNLKPEAPNFFFVNKDFEGKEEYEKGFKVDELFVIYNNGIETGKDSFFYSYSSKEIKNKIEKSFEDKDEAIKKYQFENTSGYTLKDKFISTKYNSEKIRKVNYRPFDILYSYYDEKLQRRPAFSTMQNMFFENMGLLVPRQCFGDFKHIFISIFPTDCNLTSTAKKIGSAPLFPLYLYPETNGQQSIETTPNPSKGGELERIPNLNMEIVKQIAEKIGLTFSPEKFPSSGGVAESRGGKFPSSGGLSEGRGGHLPTEIEDAAPKGRNTQNYMNLPYNPKLKQRARELRQAGNLSEVLFWNQVKNKQFKGLDFDRQKIIGNYIVDFYCSNCNVVVEIDGSSHDNKQEYDAERDKYLESLGLTIIHIPVVDVMKNMNGVMNMLFDHPALKGTPPVEGNEPPHTLLADTPPKEGNVPPRSATTPPVEGNFAPIDILDYIYAILHSPTYREQYKEFLKIDFPRVPYPKDAATFWQLVKLGGEIRQIHLLESPVVENYITQYPVDGDNVVGKPKYEVGKVYINETQYFDHVPQVAWEFYIGGYQPAQKWLKDRKDRKLEFEDILHYQKIIVALSETDRLMNEIDKIEIE